MTYINKNMFELLLELIFEINYLSLIDFCFLVKKMPTYILFLFFKFFLIKVRLFGASKYQDPYTKHRNEEPIFLINKRNQIKKLKNQINWLDPIFQFFDIYAYSYPTRSYNLLI